MKGKFFVVVTLAAGLLALQIMEKQRNTPLLATAANIGWQVFDKTTAVLRKEILIKGGLGLLLLAALRRIGQKKTA